MGLYGVLPFFISILGERKNMAKRTKINDKHAGQKEALSSWLKDTAPALFLLFGSMAMTLFFSEFLFVSGIKELWKILLRFIRMSVTLIFPVISLPFLCSLIRPILNRTKRRLVQIQEERIHSIHLLDAWLVRPLQGIGLSMLIATKLISVLQLYTGGKISESLLLPSGGFVPGKFIATTSIFVGVSMLLSLLWTFDDLGIRHYNKKTGEIRMIGKYLGALLPTIFGFYGLINLFGAYSQTMVLKYVAQMVIVLYPPFVVFAVFHQRYIQKREGLLLRRLNASPYQIMGPDKDMVILNS
jgi:hypothetical protein